MDLMYGEVDLPAASEPSAKSPWSCAHASASNGLSVRRLAFQSFSTSRKKTSHYALPSMFTTACRTGDGIAHVGWHLDLLALIIANTCAILREAFDDDARTENGTAPQKQIYFQNPNPRGRTSDL